MHNKSLLDDLLSKDMDRKQFLAHLGMGVLAVTGISTALKTMTQSSVTQTPKRTSGYGGSAYGL